MSFPSVTVIIPCRNERNFIVPCLDSILGSDYPENQLEIIVADGMSDDGTRDLLLEYCSRHPAIRMIDNPGRIVPTGLNLAIREARGEIIVRIDAHTEYAADYIRQCVDTLIETGADNAGGAHRTRAGGYLQSAIALAFHSPFAVGGARSHDVDFEGWVDTVIYGCWKKDRLLELGLFDEQLVRNQDDELNLRINRSGGKVYQSAKILSWYRPRASLTSLLRQYTQYGYWKVRVIQKHKIPASIRHLIPGLWVAITILLALAAPLSRIAALLLMLDLGLYGAANFSAAVYTCAKSRNLKFIPILPLIFLIYHFGYGFGFLRGLIDFIILRRGAGDQFTKITRESARSTGDPD